MYGNREKFSHFVFTFSGRYLVVAYRFYIRCGAIREVVKPNSSLLVSWLFCPFLHF